MNRQSDEDSYLTIQLLSYNKPTEAIERFYFLEMSTLQATRLLPQDKKITSAKIFAHTKNDKYLDEKAISKFQTVQDFNNFFSDNPDYDIQDCKIEFENSLSLNSHDDGEVSIQFSNDAPDQIFIDRIFVKYNLDKKLIDILKQKPGHYIAIDEQNNITGDFEDFDDYVKNVHD